MNGRFKDTHRKKAPSNKIPVLMKSMNMGIWVVFIHQIWVVFIHQINTL